MASAHPTARVVSSGPAPQEAQPSAFRRSLDPETLQAISRMVRERRVQQSPHVPADVPTTLHPRRTPGGGVLQPEGCPPSKRPRISPFAPPPCQPVAADAIPRLPPLHPTGRPRASWPVPASVPSAPPTPPPPPPSPPPQLPQPSPPQAPARPSSLPSTPEQSSPRVSSSWPSDSDSATASAGGVLSVEQPLPPSVRPSVRLPPCQFLFTADQAQAQAQAQAQGHTQAEAQLPGVPQPLQQWPMYTAWQQPLWQRLGNEHLPLHQLLLMMQRQAAALAWPPAAQPGLVDAVGKLAWPAAGLLPAGANTVPAAAQGVAPSMWAAAAAGTMGGGGCLPSGGRVLAPAHGLDRAGVCPGGLPGAVAAGSFTRNKLPQLAGMPLGTAELAVLKGRWGKVHVHEGHEHEGQEPQVVHAGLHPSALPVGPGRHARQPLGMLPEAGPNARATEPEPAGGGRGEGLDEEAEPLGGRGMGGRPRGAGEIQGLVHCLGTGNGGSSSTNSFRSSSGAIWWDPEPAAPLGPLFGAPSASVSDTCHDDVQVAALALVRAQTAYAPIASQSAEAAWLGSFPISAADMVLPADNLSRISDPNEEGDMEPSALVPGPPKSVSGASGPEPGSSSIRRQREAVLGGVAHAAAHGGFFSRLADPGKHVLAELPGTLARKAMDGDRPRVAPTVDFLEPHSSMAFGRYCEQD